MQIVKAISLRNTGISWLLLVLISVGIGVSIIMVPSVAWLIVGAISSLLLLKYPPYIWAMAAVLLAWVSRLLVATGFVPQVVNFLHFPFAVGGALLVSIQANKSIIVKKLSFGISALLLLSLTSWAFNGGDLLKPWLTWLVFAEPFLIIYTLVKDRVSLKSKKMLWRVALALAFAQVPFGLWQAVRIGLGDHVQGTFIGAGAGHHTAGAVALLGVLIMYSRALFEKKMRRILQFIMGSSLLLLIPIIADAKAIFAVFLISAAFLFVSRGLVRVWQMFLIAFMGMTFTYLAMVNYPPLRQIFQSSVISNVADRKVSPLILFSKHAESAPHAWLLGFGPGNTFSRVALLSQGGIVRPDSPVSWLRLSLSKVTQDALTSSLTAPYKPTATSSAWVIWSSLAGIFGDLGLLGLVIYAWFWWLLWQQARRIGTWQGLCARSVILFTVFLGITYSWLEEPGFILLAALIIGVSLREHKSFANTHRKQSLFSASGATQ